MKVKISEIKTNPNNPRVIKDTKFEKLVKSIKDFPDMLDVRPIVVNKDMVVLGGNMRLKAIKEAGYKEAVVQVVDWTEEQQKEFIIKDNLSYGDWDWTELVSVWDKIELKDWGVDLNADFDFKPNINPDSQYNEITDSDISKTSEGMNSVIQDQRKQQEVICPHCASLFKITI